MAYKIAIDASKGGNEIGISANGIKEKDFTLEISKYINKRLNDLNIDNYLIRTDDTYLTDNERINSIKNKYGTGNNIIVISNRLSNENNIEIIYALRNNSKLANTISNALEEINANVSKYYQLRDNNDSALDKDYLIRNTKDNQTIIISYGNPNNISEANYLKNNIENLGEAVVKAIANYAGIQYYPINIGDYYIVKKGDTLWAIASKNNITVDKLKELNNLKNNNLTIGQYLKLKDSNSGTNIDNNTNTYTVQKNDTLYSIAKKYNTTVDKLKAVNNITSNLLSIGQKLIIPQENNYTDKITYTVVSGDSLWKIANKYDTTVDMLKQTNNLTSNLLNIGQKLIIPSTTNYITYTVQKNETLYSIAKKYNTTVDSIKKLNNLNSNTLNIGQKLIITA